MKPIKTLACHVPGLVAHIYQDPDPQSPAEWDNLGEITYNKSGRHVLGTHPKTAEQDAEIARMVRDGEAIGLPVWAYVHSGSTIKAAYTNPFSCPWDSGRSGWVWVTKEKALKEYGRKLTSRKFLAMVRQHLIAQVEEFNMYLNGEVFGYSVEQDGEKIDSCGGMYGLDYCVKEAQSVLDAEAARIAPAKQAELFEGAHA